MDVLLVALLPLPSASCLVTHSDHPEAGTLALPLLPTASCLVTQRGDLPAAWHFPCPLQPAALSLRGVICRQLGTSPAPYSQLPCHSEG